MYLIGIAIVGYFYIRLAMWIAKKSTEKCATQKCKWAIRIIVTVVFVLIPAGDSIIGNIYFNHLCATEAGVKVYQTIELSAEYWDENGKPTFFNKYGNLDRKIWVDKIDESGGNVERYSSILAIDKDVTIVKEKVSKEVLAEITTFRYWGGWVNRNVGAHNTAASCKFLGEQNFSRNFYGQLFKPSASLNIQ